MILNVVINIIRFVVVHVDIGSMQDVTKPIRNFRFALNYYLHYEFMICYYLSNSCENDVPLRY